MPSPDRHTPRVHDVMTRDPMVVHGDDDAEPLLALFEGRDFNAVPVVDAEGHLVGVVTKLSLLRLFRGWSATGPTEVERPHESTRARRDGHPQGVGGARRRPRRAAAADDAVPRPQRAGRRAIRNAQPAGGNGEPGRPPPGRRQVARFRAEGICWSTSYLGLRGGSVQDERLAPGDLRSLPWPLGAPASAASSSGDRWALSP